MNNFCVYFHINPTTNKVFYVGKGKGYRPYSRSNRNDYWINYVNKYGFEVEIIHSNLTEHRAYEFEKLYISFFKKENLVNLTNGGKGTLGVYRNEQVRQNMSKSKKNKTPWNKGIKLPYKLGKKCIYNNEFFLSKKDVWLKYFKETSYNTFRWWDSLNKLNIIVI